MYYDIDLYVDKDKIDEYDNKLNNFLDIITKYYKELDDNFKKKILLNYTHQEIVLMGNIKYLNILYYLFM
jgi:hypothetical protein